MTKRHELQVWLVVETRNKHHRRRFEIKQLIPGKDTKMTPVNVNVGHVVNCSLVFLDQNGNPMLTTPTPDAAPVWTDTTPATGTLTAAAGGLTASEQIIAAGTDTINVSLSVGGTAFTASLPVVASAAPQVLTTVQIAATVQ